MQSPAGDIDLSAFGGAKDEIKEAAKCIAFRRNKAAVFHLMLAMEEAARTLAARGATTHDKRGNWLSWGLLAGNVDAQIVKSMPNGPDRLAWERAVSMLKSVGNAWRNPVAHPGETISDEKTEDIYNAVKGFMRSLSEVEKSAQSS